MNKSELIATVAMKADIFNSDATKAVNAILEAMHEGIVAGGLELQGFGTFTVKTRAARTSRNPKTGEAVAVPAKKVAGFKPASKLKAAVNK